ncbi:MAG TPA: hypothetical protein DFI01_01105, partial [Bacteroidales bacterium]|nr:hypothetical protein [Bacteroidales bacterium]
SFQEQYNHLLDDTSEPVASYTKTFNKLGIGTYCIIPNAWILQKQWTKENKVKYANSDSLIKEQINRIRPDVLWLECPGLTEKKWIENIRKSIPEIKLIIAYHCAPLNSKIIENFKNLDFVLTCTPGLKEYFEKNNIKSYLVYHAFNPEYLEKIGTTQKKKINNLVFSGSLFLGGNYHNYRLKLIERLLEENIDIKIYGNLDNSYKLIAKRFFYNIYRILIWLHLDKSLGKIPFFKNYKDFGLSEIPRYSPKLKRTLYPPVFGKEMLQVLRDSKITLNVHGEIAGNFAGNMRLFEATGVGSCLLTDNKANMNELFRSGKEVVTYDNIDDCIEKAKWLLENDTEREKIAKAGQKRTLETHTTEARCRLIIDILEKELQRK